MVYIIHEREVALVVVYIIHEREIAMARGVQYIFHGSEVAISPWYTLFVNEKL